MSLKVGLQLRGDYWRNLTASQQKEIKEQMPRIDEDPNYRDYRFYRSRFHKWIILNAWLLPMKTNKSIWSL